MAIKRLKIKTHRKKWTVIEAVWMSLESLKYRTMAIFASEYTITTKRNEQSKSFIIRK